MIEFPKRSIGIYLVRFVIAQAVYVRIVNVFLADVYEPLKNIADAGWIGNTFDDLDVENFKSDIGIGLSDDDQDWRIDFAKRLDKKEPITVTFRINRTF